MNILIIIEQMCVMLFLILMGYFLFRKEKLSDMSSRHLSGLVVNFCNPAVLVCSAFEEGPKASLSELFTALLVTLCLYGILILAGFIIPRIMHTPREDTYIFHFLTVYGNVGFLGIPLVSAVLGNSALIYVSISCLVYNILFYTSGISIIQKKAKSAKQSGIRDLFSKIVNAGTVSAVLTILFYLGSFNVPSVIRDTFTYTGRATTFLSMLVLGVSVAQMPLKEIFCHKKDYLFIGLRMLLLPILCILLLRQFVTNPLLLGTSALLLAVPCGNLPLMSAKEYGLKADIMARLIVLTTLLSILTIPITAIFLR